MASEQSTSMTDAEREAFLRGYKTGKGSASMMTKVYFEKMREFGASDADALDMWLEIQARFSKETRS